MGMALLMTQHSSVVSFYLGMTVEYIPMAIHWSIASSQNHLFSSCVNCLLCHNRISKFFLPACWRNCQVANWLCMSFPALLQYLCSANNDELCGWTTHTHIESKVMKMNRYVLEREIFAEHKTTMASFFHCSMLSEHCTNWRALAQIAFFLHSYNENRHWFAVGNLRWFFPPPRCSSQLITCTPLATCHENQQARWANPRTDTC